MTFDILPPADGPERGCPRCRGPMFCYRDDDDADVTYECSGCGLSLNASQVFDSVSYRLPPRDIVSLAQSIAPPVVIVIPPPKTAAERLRRSACDLLDAWGSMLPARISKEDVADYIEAVNGYANEGRFVPMCLRVVTGMFWTLLNSVGYTIRVLRGKSDK